MINEAGKRSVTNYVKWQKAVPAEERTWRRQDDFAKVH